MKVTDPVCGTRLAVDKAAAQEEYGGWVYFFCSEDCHHFFIQDPKSYAGREQQLVDSSTTGTD